MGIETFVPKLWDARLLQALDKALIYANLVNRNYEGEIQNQGDTVYINTLGDVTVKQYVKGAGIGDAEELTTTSQALLIDQADYFHLKVNDIDVVQAKAPLLDTATRNAAYKFADTIDRFVADFMSGGELITKLGDDTTPIEVNSSNAYELLVEMKTQMDKANIPTAGRWVVVPPEFEQFMLLDHARFANGQGANAEARLISGYVASAAGFNIYKSNNVPNTNETKFKIIASNNTTGTFANQIIKTEAYRSQNDFDDVVRGLQVYGGKAIRPTEIAVATVNFTP